MFERPVVYVCCTCVPDGIQDVSWRGNPGAVAIVLRRSRFWQIMMTNSTLDIADPL